MKKGLTVGRYVKGGGGSNIFQLNVYEKGTLNWSKMPSKRVRGWTLG